MDTQHGPGAAARCRGGRPCLCASAAVAMARVVLGEDWVPGRADAGTEASRGVCGEKLGKWSSSVNQLGAK